MNEAGVWKYLRKGMLGRWHAQRIESSAGNGVPDVNYAIPGKEGWIELKYVPHWPKRPTTLVKLPLRPEQSVFITKRTELGSNVFVFCRVENNFYLLTGDQAVDASDGWTKDEWGRRSLGKWEGRVDFDELRSLL